MAFIWVKSDWRKTKAPSYVPTDISIDNNEFKNKNYR